ncbi:hypothetical protein [Pedobacter frigidisoli]|uniref:hypothetical protein n=1 Tax=Pedobacter frigidisoli TaxID=2530455 RepID=UPI0019825511|nr:hypothetical protein [Pedobacter frigidisoli]
MATPLPICQKCGSTEVDWTETANEVVLEEIRFEDSSVGADHTFLKANDFLADKDTPYCICVGKFLDGTHEFHGALYGINEDNLAEWKEKIPFTGFIHFIDMAGGFKSVGFKLSTKKDNCTI